MASASAVEWTATVAMPSSLQARSTRSAISPRLAIRILLEQERRRVHSMISSGSPYSTGWPSSTRIVGDRAGARRRDLVHRLHRLDDQDVSALAHRVADVDVGPGAGLGERIGGADHRREAPRRDGRRGPRPAAAAAAGGLDRRVQSAPTPMAAGAASRVAGDADPHVVVLDLDFGQVRSRSAARRARGSVRWSTIDFLSVMRFSSAAPLGDQLPRAPASASM